MDLFEILSNPGVGNLLLLFASIIGVAGSYTLYKIRLKDRKSAMRQALKAEIESGKSLDTWVQEKDQNENPPAQIIHATAAYDSHVEDLGLLTDEEIANVSEFYSKLILVNDILQWKRNQIYNLV
ncbi:hypothetical protein [Halosimplex marinum]|uniref:hypothetical protein n=1 Tax=Halosimplex marinum TaxID=3396620 RepID=UPI003F545539